MAVINGNNLPNILNGTAGNDTINGFGGPDVLRGFAGDDVLNGGNGNDTLIGAAGNDFLNGGAGVDIMFGGAGNDTYRVDNILDQAIEAAGQGNDRIVSSMIVTTLLITPNIENLTLVNAALAGTGNNLNNQILGNNNSNQLFGLGGDDAMAGGAGTDIMVGGAGNDVLRAGARNDRLVGGSGRDTLFGDVGADRFQFLSPNDSPAVLANEDTILDFNRAQGDKIDLLVIDADTTAVGNQAFTFVGANPAPAKGQLSFAVVGGQTFVQGNVDNDAALEIQFKVNGPGVPPMLAGDFVL
jgi:Ca2+-binding RTX toxin-like protein